MNKKNQKAIAIIPARGGSKGIPKKNLVELGGVPLIAWSILVALQSKHVSRVVVSTDCPEIAQVAKNYGADVPFMRDSTLATDNISVGAAVKDVRKFLELHGENFDASVVLYPTHPFRTPDLIDTAIETCFTKSYYFEMVKSFYFSPSYYFYCKEGHASSIETEDSGLVFGNIGSLSACAKLPIEYQQAKNAFEKRLLFMRLQEAGDRRLEAGVTYLQIDNPVMHVDIDSMQDLEHARQLVALNKVPWTPQNATKSFHVTNKLSSSFTSSISVNDDHIHVIALDQGVPTNKKAILSSNKWSSDPVLLRATIDSLDEMKGYPVILLKQQALAPNDISEFKESPTIGIDTNKPLPMGLRKVFSRYALARVFLNPKDRKIFESILGNLNYKIDNPNIEVEYPKFISHNDELQIDLRDINNAQVCVTTIYKYNNGHWDGPYLANKTQTSYDLKIQFNVNSFSFKCSHETNTCIISMLRPGTTESNDLVITKHIQIKNLIEYSHSTDTQLNKLTGAPITGRQIMPPIYEWSGWAFLPKTVKHKSYWQVSACSSNPSRVLAPNSCFNEIVPRP